MTIKTNVTFLSHNIKIAGILYIPDDSGGKTLEGIVVCHPAGGVKEQTAERYLKEHLGKDNALKLKAWKAEAADLTQKKSRLYGSLQTLKAEVQEAEAVKKCVEQAVQPEQTRAKTQSKRRDMEL